MRACASARPRRSTRMENALVQDPAPRAPARRLVRTGGRGAPAAAGLATLADLLALIQRRRQRWYTGVPKLGPKGPSASRTGCTARVVAALHPFAAGDHAAPPAAAGPPGADAAAVRRHRAGHRPAGGAARAEPAELDGSHGLNRAPVPAHQAELDTDLHAIDAWVGIRGNQSVHTARAYRREAERLLLWAIVQKRKPLSSLNTLDCAEYVDGFLKDPQPAGRWVGRGRVERFDPAWRPFAAPLNDRSREAARKILHSMCSWLVRQRYLASNPFDGLPRFNGFTPIDATGRTLTHAQWQYVLQATTHAFYRPGQRRDHFALLLAYATGLRRTELAAATTGDLSRNALDGTLDDAWELQVDGKGRRRRAVPIPHRLMDELKLELAARKIPQVLGNCPKDTPLLAHLQTGRGLTADGVARLYKRIFERAASLLEATYPGAAVDLRRASTHWLRHTHSNHALDAGADLRDVQANLGHASLQTTTVYVKSDKARRFRAMDAFFTEALGPGSE